MSYVHFSRVQKKTLVEIKYFFSKYTVFLQVSVKIFLAD